MGIKVFAGNEKLIHIGRVGENLATTIVFNVEKQLDFGTNGTFKILVNQNGELSEITPNINGLNIDDKTLEWNILENNTLKKGKGRCQIVYTIGSIISKSEIYDFIVTEGYSVT